MVQPQGGAVTLFSEAGLRPRLRASVPALTRPGDSPSLCPAPQSLPLISASRWLLKRGELFVVEETGLFRKLASRPTCYLFLFNDVLVITKKKRWARLWAQGCTALQWAAGSSCSPRAGEVGWGRL